MIPVLGQTLTACEATLEYEENIGSQGKVVIPGIWFPLLSLTTFKILEMYWYIP